MKSTPTGDDRLPIVLLILDGLGDRACPTLDGQTPTEAANTPNLDRLCQRGSTGALVPFGPGRCTSSERSHWALFGYAEVPFPGRAALEAVGTGQTPPTAIPLFQLALRCGEATKGVVQLGARAARGRDEADAEALFNTLFEHQPKHFAFSQLPLRCGERILVVNGATTHEVSDTDALFEHLHPWMRPCALADADDPTGAAALAGALESWLLEGRERLRQHPVNQQRRAAGRPPLDTPVTKWASWIDPAMPAFDQQVGLRGAAVTDTALYRGLAGLCGMQNIDLPYAADDPAGDMRRRLEAAESLLTDADFVHVHVKATDEAGHSKDPGFKRSIIEATDAGLTGLTALSGRAIVAVTGDHATPSVSALMHSGDPTPLVLAGPGIRPDAVQQFGERTTLQGELGRLRSEDVLPLMISHANRPFFLGHRPGPWSSIALPNDPEPMPLMRNHHE